MSRARPRARRSRYSVSHRLSRSVPALIGAVLLVAIVVTATVAYRRIDDFLSATTGKHLTLGAIVCLVGIFFTAAYALAMQAWVYRSFELAARNESGA